MADDDEVLESAASGNEGHRPLLAERSRAAVLFSSAPIIFAFILLAAAGGVLLAAWMGGSADGERLDITWSGDCATEAGPMVLARAESIGLGAPELEVTGDQVRLVATMTGYEDDRTAMPALLGRRGLLEVTHGDEVVLTQADVEKAYLRLDESGMPFTNLELASEPGDALNTLTVGDPEGELVISMDGEILAVRPNIDSVKNRELKVLAGDGMTRLRMRRAVDRALLLEHGPLPCTLRVVGVEPVR